MPSLAVHARALYRSQARPSRPPKGDPDAQWSHDLYEDPDKPSLSSRLSASAAAPRKPDSILVQRAIREATATCGISIKGASISANGNVVQVDGLVKGTTPADVEAIFRRCGPIISSDLVTNPASENVIVRLTFKQAAHAAAAVAKFDKQPADGRILHKFVGIQSIPRRAVSRITRDQQSSGGSVREGKGGVNVVVGQVAVQHGERWEGTQKFHTVAAKGAVVTATLRVLGLGEAS